jgi:ribosomal protein L6P/L9E
MSRIGKLPVNLPAGVTVEVSADNTVSVKGPLGTLSQKVEQSFSNSQYQWRFKFFRHLHDRTQRFKIK